MYNLKFLCRLNYNALMKENFKDKKAKNIIFKFIP